MGDSKLDRLLWLTPVRRGQIEAYLIAAKPGEPPPYLSGLVKQDILAAVLERLRVLCDEGLANRTADGWWQFDHPVLSRIDWREDCCEQCGELSVQIKLRGVLLVRWSFSNERCCTCWPAAPVDWSTERVRLMETLIGGLTVGIPERNHMAALRAKGASCTHERHTCPAAAVAAPV